MTAGAASNRPARGAPGDLRAGIASNRPGGRSCVGQRGAVAIARSVRSPWPSQVVRIFAAVCSLSGSVLAGRVLAGRPCPRGRAYEGRPDRGWPSWLAVGAEALRPQRGRVLAGRPCQGISLEERPCPRWPSASQPSARWAAVPSLAVRAQAPRPLRGRLLAGRPCRRPSVSSLAVRAPAGRWCRVPSLRPLSHAGRVRPCGALGSSLAARVRALRPLGVRVPASRPYARPAC